MIENKTNNIPDVLTEILSNRGISGEENLNEYFSNKPKATYNPFLLNNMEAGVDLILASIEKNKKIVIFGDYDTDGITSTAVLLKVLGGLTDNLDYYIPSRIKEGYGLNKEAVSKIKKEGGDLLITVDCGSVSKEEVKYAKEIGLDVIVTDHHTIGDKMADGIVINPKAPNDKYPFKELAGVGVAYKLAQGIQRRLNLPKNVITEVLDLVAIGTIGDMVSLTDENRTLVKYGIRLIKSGEGNKGLKRLIEMSSINNQKINSRDISYGVVPKINASGRLGDATIGVKLMKATTADEIEKYCNILIDNNNERKRIQDDVYEKCVDIVEKKHLDDNFLVVDANDSHEGITGIVAGKLKEKYQKPTIIVTNNENGVKGTGRSVAGVNLYELINNHNELFVRFGGHKAACGFSARKENLNEIRRYLNADMDLMISLNPNILTQGVQADKRIEINDADADLVKALELMEPTGSGNEVPTFAINDVKIKEYYFMGNEDKHAKFVATDTQGHQMVCILFGKASEYRSLITSDNSINLIGAVELNEWNNKSNIQIRVKSIS
ncbi:MAG: single-stranded-DNA-specific exonuclease RecJ [Peptostreptococcaceae bacterium]|nr:single-stranded-DNA-specific exonuclease RecJ [Peptostreptococcaceae bacterium]